MIHDAQVEVTCDHCLRESAFVGLEFVYRTYSHESGYYDHDDAKVEKKLVSEYDWIVRDGKHFCCDVCAERGAA